MSVAQPNRAGMVCFNRAGDVLICSALGKSACWVFPKGHLEVGEATWEAAERECLEECRVYATSDWGSPIGIQSYDYRGESVVVEWWAGLAIYLVDPPEQGDELSWGFRLTKWCSPTIALDLLSFPAHRNILRRALCLPEVVEAAQVTLTDSKEVT